MILRSVKKMHHIIIISTEQSFKLCVRDTGYWEPLVSVVMAHCVLLFVYDIVANESNVRAF